MTLQQHTLRFINATYKEGAETPSRTDCSGILRSYHHIMWNANEFLQKLYKQEAGAQDIGNCLFLLDQNGKAYHVAPCIDYRTYMYLDIGYSGTAIRDLNEMTHDGTADFTIRTIFQWND